MELFDTLSKLGVQTILIGLAVLFGCLLITRGVMRLVEKTLEHLHAIDPALHSMIRAATKFVLYFLSVMITASYVGIPVTSILALFSVVGLAISLAVQGVLSNLAGGIIILISKPFTLGDLIETDGTEGFVKEIGILHTRLLTGDGRLIFVPNNMLYTSRLINHSGNGKRRVDIAFSASYNHAPEQVRAAALAAAATVSGILPDPAPFVRLNDYGESAINYVIRAWTNWEDYYSVSGDLIEALYGAFKEHGVEMTYPHINVHMN